MKKRPISSQRRSDLCDAAVELLAAEGARGLTHRGVDRRAGFAEGTTSFYYQTRAELLRGALDRIVELDVVDYTAALASDGHANSLLHQLAESAIENATVNRARVKARFELMMIASREPALKAVFDDFFNKFVALSEAAVGEVQQTRGNVDQVLIKQQAFAVVTFLGGFLFRLAYGLADGVDAAALESLLRGVISGVAEEHKRSSAAPGC
ncbi:TetR family transcriptional regulator [Mycolicibacterium moriokaense]|nr:TetR family transcriptional regulator [Mycolicibacterium moriokaense]